MKTHNLTVNQLADADYAWYLEYLDALDRKDIDAYSEFLADDVSLQMNDDAPVVGKQQVVEGLRGYWQSFGRLEHDLLAIVGDERAFALEARNHYTRLDGAEVTLLAVAFTERNPDGQVTAVRLHSNVSPLFAPRPDA